jgi:hypothetical protein
MAIALPHHTVTSIKSRLAIPAAKLEKEELRPPNQDIGFAYFVHAFASNVNDSNAKTCCNLSISAGHPYLIP